MEYNTKLNINFSRLELFKTQGFCCVIATFWHKLPLIWKNKNF